MSNTMTQVVSKNVICEMAHIQSWSIEVALSIIVLLLGICYMSAGAVYPLALSM